MKNRLSQSLADMSAVAKFKPSGDTSLVPLAELMKTAEPTEKDIESAIAEWDEEPPQEEFTKVLRAD